MRPEDLARCFRFQLLELGEQVDYIQRGLLRYVQPQDQLFDQVVPFAPLGADDAWKRMQDAFNQAEERIGVRAECGGASLHDR